MLLMGSFILPANWVLSVSSRGVGVFHRVVLPGCGAMVWYVAGYVIVIGIFHKLGIQLCLLTVAMEEMH